MPPDSASALSTAQTHLDDVSVRIDDTQVLSGVSVRLTAPRIAVIGANGSGKLTFARLLNGLVTPTTGTATVRGLDPVRDREALRRRVGFVFANPDAQILMPTPAEDLALSLRGRPRAEIVRRVQQTLDENGLGGVADAPASALSGGQRQLLALASVLITGPELIVADEPTTLLDLRNTRRIGDLLLAQTAQVVLVTHDLELAARCDQAILFDRGRVAEVGDPRSVIAHYRRSCG